MIERVAHRIAVKIKEASPEETVSVEVMKFALIGILHNAITIAAALLVGMLTGKFRDVLIAVISFMILRLVSGGFHFKSPWSCFFFSASIFVVIPFIPLAADHPYFHILTAVSLLLCALLAPSNIREHIRVPEKYFFVFKILSLAVVALSYLVAHPVVTLALLAQSLTLIPGSLKKEVRTHG